jgi:hypothetical protein
MIISMNTIEKLILGHMPFIGVSYQSKKKDIEYKKKFSDMNEISKVINASLEMNVKKFAAASPHSSHLSHHHVRVLKNKVSEGHDIELIPCISIPIMNKNIRIDAFRRWSTYLNHEEELYHDVRQNIINDPVMNFREDWKIKLPKSKPYNSIDFEGLKIDWSQVDNELEYFINLPVSHIEPGSETDFLALANRWDLFGELMDRVRERGFRGILFGVHHAGITIPKMDNELDGYDGYVTPLNPLGVMMFPNMVSAENAVRNTERAVYSIKSMAGGRINPMDAFNYVSRFDVDGCFIGCASVAELKEDFKAASKALSK